MFCRIHTHLRAAFLSPVIQGCFATSDIWLASVIVFKTVLEQIKKKEVTFVQIKLCHVSSKNTVSNFTMSRVVNLKIPSQFLQNILKYALVLCDFLCLFVFRLKWLSGLVAEYRNCVFPLCDVEMVSSEIHIQKNMCVCMCVYFWENTGRINECSA